MPSKRLTEAFVRSTAAPPGKRTIEYFDQVVSGLVLRITENGAKSWCIRYRIHGRQRRLSIGKYPRFGLADARNHARELLQRADLGHDPAIERQSLAAAPTFEELAEEFLARHVKDLRSATEYRRIIHREFYPRWRHRKAADITRREIVKLLDEIHDRGCNVMPTRVFAVIRKMYNWGIGRDLVETSPCDHVKCPGRPQPRDRILSEKELLRFWDACDVAGPVMASMFRLRLVTAQRGMELCHMRWSDIEEDWWTIPGELSKNRLSHRVPLTPLALSLIERAANKSEWVFPSPWYTDTPLKNYQKAFQRVRKTADLLDIRSHDLRRTAASHMTSIGIPRLVVSKILNHVETGVTAVYDRHSYDREKRDALARWSVHLEQLFSGKPQAPNVIQLETA